MLHVATLVLASHVGAQPAPSTTGTAPQASTPANEAPAAPAGRAEGSGHARHEVYLTSGLTYFSSDRRLIAGLGGGPGYRFWLTKQITLHLEGRALFYLGQAYSAAAGASYAFHVGVWSPTAGAQAFVVTGDSVAVVTADQRALPPSAAWAAQVRLAPLRFENERFTASALELDIGYGDDAGFRAFALTVSFLSLGVRL